MTKNNKKQENLPKVRSNLPKELKGNIQELLCNNKELEEKRKKSLSRASKDNLFAFKNGNKINRQTRTLYCNYCDVSEKCTEYQKTDDKSVKILCAFDPIFGKPLKPDNFKIRDEEIVFNAYESLIKALVQRLARGILFEQLDGGLQDKNITKAFKTVTDLIKRILP